MNRYSAALAVLLAALLIAASPGAANADQRNYYGKNVRLVADDLDCSRYQVTDPVGDSNDFYMGARCYFDGVRLGIATFRGPRQHAAWKAEVTALLKAYYPPGNYYFAADRGAIVVSPSFGFRAAQIGQRRLHASLVKIHVN